MAIKFFNEDINFDLKNKNRFKKLLKVLADNNKKRVGEINYIFCNDSYLYDINMKYLGHDTYTDIITFDYVADDVISGDIYISVDRVKENADNFEVSFYDEILRIISHGFLHLLGYKDKNKRDKEIMTLKENEAMNIFMEL